MRYYRCKCGEYTAYGSMPPYRCSKCEKCGSDLAESPDSHQEPTPHDFERTRQELADGSIVYMDRCRYCHRTPHQIERERGLSANA